MKQTQAARLKDDYEVDLEERTLDLAEGEVLVRTHQASICDADLRAYKGLFFPGDLPSFEWLGHEGGGEVVEIGSKVREFKPGDFVMIFGPHNSWSHYFKAPVQDLHLAPDGLDRDVASLGEPTAVGMYGVFEAGVQLGDDVCVTGLNYQGLIAVEALKRRGARRLIAVDYSDRHLEIAAARGADVTINSERDDAKEAVLQLTGGAGVHVSYHSCGYWNPKTEEYFNLALDIVRDEGLVVSVPDIMEPIRANLHRLHHHAVEIRFPALMHHGPAFRQRWVHRVLQPVADGLINIKSLITGRYPLNQARQAIEDFAQNPDHVKVVLTPS